MSDIALGVMMVLLVVLFIISMLKLWIYLSIYFMFSKRTNADKIKFIAYNPFFKNHYNVILNLANYRITIEYAFVGILILITGLATLFNRKKWITYNDFGFTYYIGDITEYYFVDYFVKIILTISFVCALALWYVYYQAEDNKLVESEKILKKFILDHIDYTYLAKKSVIPKYNIDAYLKIMPNILDDQIDLFNISLTVNIMNNPKFKSLSKDLKKYSIEIYPINDDNVKPAVVPPTEKINEIKANVVKNIEDLSYYMIANYYHNDDAPLPTLHVLLYNIYANIKNNEIKRTYVKNIIDAYLNPKPGNGAKQIKEIYEICTKYFKNTIIIYKGIYDKYYTYYVYNILITNFLIIYVFLILIYIWIKKFTKEDNDFFTFDTEFRKYGMFLIAVYYALTCPAILFGIN